MAPKSSQHSTNQCKATTKTISTPVGVPSIQNTGMLTTEATCLKVKAEAFKFKATPQSNYAKLLSVYHGEAAYK